MRDFTLGVEEEYQLVCPRTGELQSRARDVLAADWSGEIIPENQQTMLEIGTRVCASARDLDREIRRLRLQVASAAASEDLRSVAAGIHPFSRWEGQTRTTGERYQPSPPYGTPAAVPLRNPLPTLRGPAGRDGRGRG